MVLRRGSQQRRFQASLGHRSRGFRQQLLRITNTVQGIMVSGKREASLNSLSDWRFPMGWSRATSRWANMCKLRWPSCPNTVPAPVGVTAIIEIDGNLGATRSKTNLEVRNFERILTVHSCMSSHANTKWRAYDLVQLENKATPVLKRAHPKAGIYWKSLKLELWIVIIPGHRIFQSTENAL